MRPSACSLEHERPLAFRDGRLSLRLQPLTAAALLLLLIGAGADIILPLDVLQGAGTQMATEWH